MLTDQSRGSAAFLQRTLADYAQGYAGLVAALWGPMQSGKPDVSGLREMLVEPYRRLFTPPFLPVPPAAANVGAGAGPAFLRWQGAARRFAGVTSAIAVDASRRFAAALGQTGPDAPPITTLAELHALWIDCGEAAYAEAAHGDDFAAAQAELLAALVELRAAAP